MLPILPNFLEVIYQTSAREVIITLNAIFVVFLISPVGGEAIARRMGDKITNVLLINSVMFMLYNLAGAGGYLALRYGLAVNAPSGALYLSSYIASFFVALLIGFSIAAFFRSLQTYGERQKYVTRDVQKARSNRLAKSMHEQRIQQREGTTPDNHRTTTTSKKSLTAHMRETRTTRQVKSDK